MFLSVDIKSYLKVIWLGAVSAKFVYVFALFLLCQLRRLAIIANNSGILNERCRTTSNTENNVKNVKKNFCLLLDVALLLCFLFVYCVQLLGLHLLHLHNDVKFKKVSRCLNCSVLLRNRIIIISAK